MWSVGCVLYELLSGLEPFDADTVGSVIRGRGWTFVGQEEELYAAIQDARPSFTDPEWKEATKSAKDLTKKLLVRDTS